MLPTLHLPTGIFALQQLAAERLAEHPVVATDAVRRLMYDSQATVRRLLARFALMRTEPAALRANVVRLLCAELAVHLQVQEELLYPELRDQLRDSRPIDEAEVEHECLREQMEALIDLAPNDPQYDARVMVVAELFELSLQREQAQLHPLLRRCGLDSRDLGASMARRRDELLADLAARPGDLLLRPENEDADPVGAPPR